MAKPFLALLCLLAALPLNAADLLVRRVVDGDTLLLSNGERVRLLGVDTPESHSSAKLKRDSGGSKKRAAAIKELGRAATAFVKEVVEGRRVRLKTDLANATRGHRDRYGRSVAYVYFDPPPCEELEPWVADAACDTKAYEEGFLNALIVEAGFGSAYTRYPFDHLERFRKLERKAREAERGLWSPRPLRADAYDRHPGMLIGRPCLPAGGDPGVSPENGARQDEWRVTDNRTKPRAEPLARR